ncbi:hypothetical protein [Actinospica robiniae]|uniref:hypothetical protein n=1 Tax=Actinospica robiniae TaxID=304901 RepID=UPI0004207C9C|nr:hypothetical protein [Actinospica robiniae]
MPGKTLRALPIAAALLTLAACSSSTSAASSPTSSASTAPYRAACKAEDKAYHDSEYILDGNLTARKAYDQLKDYEDAIDAAETNAIEGSNLWNDLVTESTKVEYMAMDSDISQDVAQGSLKEFKDARGAVVADCESYGYVSVAQTDLSD